MASSMDDLGQDYILRWDPDAEADNDILNSNFSNIQCSPSSSALRAVPSESPQAAPSSSRRGKRPADSDAKSPQSLAQPVRGRNVAKKAKTTAGSVERPVNPRRKKQATPGVESSMSPDQPTQDRKAAKASKKTLPLQEPKTRRGVLARISFSTEEGNLDEVEPFVGVTDLSNSFIDRGAVDRYNIREYPVTKAHSQAETPRGMVDDIRGWVSVQVTSRKLKADGKRLGLRILEASSCGVYFGKDIRDSNRNTRCEEWGPKVTVQGSATGRRQQQMGGVYGVYPFPSSYSYVTIANSSPGVPTRGTTATSIRPDQGATPSTSYRSKPGMSLVSSATQNVTDTGPTSVDWDPRGTLHNFKSSALG